MVRLVIDMIKARRELGSPAQLGLFGSAPPAAAAAPSSPGLVQKTITVAPHVRQTEHGSVTVPAHQRVVEVRPDAPKAPPAASTAIGPTAKPKGKFAVLLGHREDLQNVPAHLQPDRPIAGGILGQEVGSLAEAQQYVQRFGAGTGAGMTSLHQHHGIVVDPDNKPIARISQNGRAWHIPGHVQTLGQAHEAEQEAWKPGGTRPSEIAAVDTTKPIGQFHADRAVGKIAAAPPPPDHDAAAHRNAIAMRDAARTAWEQAAPGSRAAREADEDLQFWTGKVAHHETVQKVAAKEAEAALPSFVEGIDDDDSEYSDWENAPGTVTRKLRDRQIERVRDRMSDSERPGSSRPGVPPKDGPRDARWHEHYAPNGVPSAEAFDLYSKMLDIEERVSAHGEAGRRVGGRAEFERLSKQLKALPAADQKAVVGYTGPRPDGPAPSSTKPEAPRSAAEIGDGSVIGQTPSGRTMVNRGFASPAEWLVHHDGWGKADHLAASEAHARIAKEVGSVHRFAATPEERSRQSQRFLHHMTQRDAHAMAAKGSRAQAAKHQQGGATGYASGYGSAPVPTPANPAPPASTAAPDTAAPASAAATKPGKVTAQDRDAHNALHTHWKADPSATIQRVPSADAKHVRRLVETGHAEYAGKGVRLTEAGRAALERPPTVAKKEATGTNKHVLHTHWSADPDAVVRQVPSGSAPHVRRLIETGDAEYAPNRAGVRLTAQGKQTLKSYADDLRKRQS